MVFFDSHTHVNLPAFDADRNEVLERARNANVMNMLNVVMAPDPTTVQEACDLIRNTEGMIGSIGVHPHDAKLFTSKSLDSLRNVLNQSFMKAVGEIGLDFYYDNSPRKEQIRCFQDQLDLALEENYPVIIHCRDAFVQTYEEIQKRDVFRSVGGVFHCFTGNAEEAEKVVELGGHVSFSGILTFKKSETLREAAERVPLDRLLIETDAPFLSPSPYRGKRNEPAHVVEVAKALAQIKKVSLEELANQTNENALTLFRC